MKPVTTACLLSAIALMATYKVLEKVESHSGALEIVRAEIPVTSMEEINTQAFYPVMVESIQKVGVAGSGASVNSVFYTPPPEVVEEPVEAPVVLSYQPVSQPEPLEPVAPINFIALQKDDFSLQAVLEEQQSAIINGRLFGVGEVITTDIVAEYQESDGTAHRETLRPRITRIVNGSVWLAAEHSKGWDQSARLTVL